MPNEIDKIYFEALEILNGTLQKPPMPEHLMAMLIRITQLESHIRKYQEFGERVIELLEIIKAKTEGTNA